MPRERVSQKSFNVETGVLTIGFFGKEKDSNGKPKVAQTLQASVVDFGIPADVYGKLPAVARHTIGNGMSQKLGDAYADSSDGTPFENSKALLEQVKSGTWVTRGGGGERTSFLLQALVEFSGKTEADVRTYLDGLSDEDRKALPKVPQIEAIIARLRKEAADRAAKDAAERAKGAPKTETPSVLAGLVKGNGKSK